MKNSLDSIRVKYQGTVVEWGVSHRDFTPWNTCMVGTELFVFDFEYALLNAPKGLDQWHYFVQTKIFEKRYNMKQIAIAFRKLKDVESSLFEIYLLDIIALYLMRGSNNDIKTANDRAELLCLIVK